MTAEAQRLNRYLAACGLGSRRGVEVLVAEGRVAIDGVLADSPGQRVEEGSVVTLDGAPVAPDAHAYILLNKPKDVVTTVRDTHGRRTVIDLVGADLRLFPVGRLDAETTGLLLLTNDGELAARLMHPRHGVEKTYEGRKRQVRRMCEAVGHPVISLHRSAYGGLRRGAMKAGASRPLLPAEVELLRSAAANG